MRSLILGTAGHIDHGKTALVKALTGVDTDRLKEEKERGITVDLGFAVHRPGEDLSFGVVDVPGHEGFIRNMVAGASGMDLVLFVVAADEGVMPQTREHLAIVQLLGVPRLLVAITKADLVEPEWIDLVADELRELLAETPYAGASMIPVSARTGSGIPELNAALKALGDGSDDLDPGDVGRMPVDRVFTIRGAGTVVTGTLWSGILRTGDRVALLPGEVEARVRSLQVHGEEVGIAEAGKRVAVGLTGSKISHHSLSRGQTLVTEGSWTSSWMLTCRVSVLPDTGWGIQQGQRVRVHLGTAEVLARVALLQGPHLSGGEEGWAQLRLETPVLARAKDHVVLRSYSPVTTIGGGRVVEVAQGKRKRLRPGEARWMATVLDSDPEDALAAHMELSGWAGAWLPRLSQDLGIPPPRAEAAVSGLVTSARGKRVGDHILSAVLFQTGKEKILSTLAAFHEGDPLRPGMPLEELRQVIPGDLGPKVGEEIIQDLAGDGRVRVARGHASLMEHTPRLSSKQKALQKQLRTILVNSGIAPPSTRELGEQLGEGEELVRILKTMEHQGELLALDPELYFSAGAVRDAAVDVIRALGGRRDLGPADFKEVLPLTRRHLLPLLRYFDTVGVTVRLQESRRVSSELPEDMV